MTAFGFSGTDCDTDIPPRFGIDLGLRLRILILHLLLGSAAMARRYHGGGGLFFFVFVKECMRKKKRSPHVDLFCLTPTNTLVLTRSTWPHFVGFLSTCFLGSLEGFGDPLNAACDKWLVVSLCLCHGWSEKIQFSDCTLSNSIDTEMETNGLWCKLCDALFSTEVLKQISLYSRIFSSCKMLRLSCVYTPRITPLPSLIPIAPICSRPPPTVWSCLFLSQVAMVLVGVGTFNHNSRLHCQVIQLPLNHQTVVYRHDSYCTFSTLTAVVDGGSKKYGARSKYKEGNKLNNVAARIQKLVHAAW